MAAEVLPQKRQRQLEKLPPTSDQCLVTNDQGQWLASRRLRDGFAELTLSSPLERLSQGMNLACFGVA